jgi:eukaryotic-like serine/threonine-protein kinase
VAPAEPIQLGAFDLVEPIGRGGMAEVWGGRHRGSGTPVAVKILTDEATRRRAWIVNFRNEIRAVAGLRHDAIVQIDDYGEIDEETEDRFGGRFRAGCPYLVMERVPGGSLASRLGKMAWPEVRFVLLSLLDALAYAHARGLVHRDITPGNVLGGGTVVKLADFGLCHWLTSNRGQRERATTAGTPAYMAPEQWEGRWRDFGPWTDLYGVGCLGWALATGTPPFGESRGLEAMRDSHMRIEIPRLKGTSRLPPGLEDWLSLCLRKDPAQRFQVAADAIWRLAELPLRAEGEASDEEQPTLSMAALRTIDAAILSGATASIEQHVVVSELAGPGVLATRGKIRVPRTWRQAEPEQEPRLLPGAGLRLLGFRTVPLVGRVDEQDRLWSSLLEVVGDGEPRAVVLRGPSGCGKSRLARWLSERAQEVGAALALRADHDPGSAGSDPLVAMVRDHLRLFRIDEDELTARLRKHLADHGDEDPYELGALRGLLRPRAAAAATRAYGLGPSSPAERRAIVGRVLRRLARHRPLVLWFDDVQWGADTLRFARDLVADDGGPLPVLIVMTVRDEALAERPQEEGLLTEAVGSERWEDVRVGPLAERHWGTLIRQILLLEDDLAAQVQERAAGNPLFAIQLIADWVQRGFLTLGEGGFRLLPGVEARLPDNIHDVWTERISDMLARLPGSDGQALELAAVLGDRVDQVEWSIACRILGAEPSRELMDRLLANRLARYVGDPAEGRWTFAHGLLRESLERRVAEAGRLAALHLACVRMLVKRAAPGTPERLGRHLLAADSFAAALQPLLDGAAERANLGDFPRAEELVRDRERALLALGAEPSDPRWGDGLVLLTGLEIERNRLDRAAELAGKLHERALAAGWKRLDGWARQILGRVACLRGELAEAREQLEAASETAAARSDGLLAAACQAGMGLVMMLEGKLGSARWLTGEARAGFLAEDLEHGAAAMSLQLSLVALQRGDLDEAERNVAEALRLFEELGARNSVAQCLTQRGAIARARGDDRAAQSELQGALSLYRSLGASGYLAPLVKLAVLHVDAGRYGEARALLEEAMAGLERIGGWTSMGVLQVLLLPSVAAAGDWEAWDRLAPEADLMLSGAGLVHEDVPRLARLGADLALEAGHVDRARRIYLLALSQWRRLGQLEPARELAELLPSLG